MKLCLLYIRSGSELITSQETERTNISNKQIPDFSSLQQPTAAHSFRSHVLSSCWEAEQLLNTHQAPLQTEALCSKSRLMSHSWPLLHDLAPLGTRVSHISGSRRLCLGVVSTRLLLSMPCKNRVSIGGMAAQFPSRPLPVL